MSNLETLAALGVIIVILAILIAVCLGLSAWAQGFTPNRDPNHKPHLPKKDEIPTEDGTS